VRELTARWVCLAVRGRWLVLALFAGAVVLSLYGTARHLRMNTDTADLLSPDLPFLRAYRRYKALFPQYTDSLVAVVEAATPEGARRAAGALAARLRDHPERFEAVYLPGADGYFLRNALLFLDMETLEETADRLITLQPFLGRILRDPSLRGLAEMLSDGLEAQRTGRHVPLGPALDVLDRAVRARLKGGGGPVSWERLLFPEAAKGPARAFVVFRPRLDFSSLRPAHPALRRARALASALPAAPDESVRVRITGGPAMADEEMRNLEQGMAWAAGLSLAGVLAVLYLGLRSVRLTAAVLVTLLAGLVLTAGFATVSVGTLNMISVVFAVLYIGLGVDFGIHWALALRERLLAGEPVVPALGRLGHFLGPTLALCALTTTAGFFAFLPTDYRGVSELGLIAGTGMLIALTCTLTLLPALLGTRGLASAARGSAAGLPERLAAWPQRHAVGVRWSSLALALSGLLLLPGVRFDPDPLHLRDPQGEAVTTYRMLMRESERRPPEAVVLVPDTETAQTLAARLESLSTVSEALWLGSFVPDDQAPKLELIDELALVLGPELATLPQPRPAPFAETRLALRALLQRLRTAREDSGLEPALRARAARLAESLQTWLQASAPDRPGAEARMRALEGDLLHYLPDTLHRLATALEARPVALADLPPALVARWRAADGTLRVAAHPSRALDTPVALGSFVAAVRGAAPEATGAPILHVEAARVVIRAFAEALLLATAVIVLLLTLTLRRARDVAAVLVPLAAAAIGTGAAMVALDIPFNFANIIALPLLLGIGVDNGIHMVARLRAGDRNPLAHATGRAVLVSALTTLASFGALAFSAHPGTASLGVVLTLGLGLTLAATLVMLPALAAGWSRARPPDRRAHP